MTGAKTEARNDKMIETRIIDLKKVPLDTDFNSLRTDSLRKGYRQIVIGNAAGKGKRSVWRNKDQLPSYWPNHIPFVDASHEYYVPETDQKHRTLKNHHLKEVVLSWRKSIVMELKEPVPVKVVNSVIGDETLEHIMVAQGKNPNETSPPAEEILPAEASPAKEKIIPAEASPPTKEILPAEASPPAEEIIPAEASPPTDEIIPAEASPPTKEILPADTNPTTEETPLQIQAPHTILPPSVKTELQEGRPTGPTNLLFHNQLEAAYARKDPLQVVEVLRNCSVQELKGCNGMLQTLANSDIYKPKMEMDFCPQFHNRLNRLVTAQHVICGFGKAFWGSFHQLSSCAKVTAAAFGVLHLEHYTHWMMKAFDSPKEGADFLMLPPPSSRHWTLDNSRNLFLTGIIHLLNEDDDEIPCRSSTMLLAASMEIELTVIHQSGATTVDRAACPSCWVDAVHQVSVVISQDGACHPVAERALFGDTSNLRKRHHKQQNIKKQSSLHLESNNRVAFFKGYEIFQADVERLCTNQWLDDNIVNFALQKISSKEQFCCPLDGWRC